MNCPLKRIEFDRMPRTHTISDMIHVFSFCNDDDDGDQSWLTSVRKCIVYWSQFINRYSPFIVVFCSNWFYFFFIFVRFSFIFGLKLSVIFQWYFAQVMHLHASAVRAHASCLYFWSVVLSQYMKICTPFKPNLNLKII